MIIITTPVLNQGTIMILRVIIFSLGITGSAFCMNQKATLVAESVKVTHPVRNNNIKHCTVYRPNSVKTIISDESKPEKGYLNFTVSRTLTRDSKNKIEATYEGGYELNMDLESISSVRAHALFLKFVTDYNLVEKAPEVWLALADAELQTKQN